MSLPEHKTDRPHAPQKSGGRWLWLAIYLPVWGFCAAWYWLGMSSSGGWIMTYCILAMLVLLPLATLASAVAIGWRREFGRLRWAALILLPVLYAAHYLATMSLSTALGITRVAPMDFAVILYAVFPALIGLLAGMGAHRLWDAVRTRRTSGR